MFDIGKRLTPPFLEPLVARIFDATTDSVERVLGRGNELTPPLRIRLHVGPFLDPWLYRTSAERNLEGFRELGNLSPDASFLDIGCGAGRVASALTRYLSANGSYDGFDIAQEPVAWCRRRISPRFPNFQFYRIDAFSRRYNPRGAKRSSGLAFSYPDNRFDFVFAGSVYTHLLPEEVTNFVSETCRVLKPGGVSFATFCLLNGRSLPIVDAGQSLPPLLYRYGECRVRDFHDPASFIAHPEQFVRELYRKTGLRVEEPIKYGSWVAPSRKSAEVDEPHGFSQDILVASKPN